MTAREFSKQKDFISLCQKARVIPSRRQASKFRRKTGIAFQVFTHKAKPLANSKTPGFWVDSWTGKEA
jgi:hypothetical protein